MARPGGKAGRAEKSAPASGEKRADGGLKTAATPFVVNRCGEVQRGAVKPRRNPPSARVATYLLQGRGKIAAPARGPASRRRWRIRPPAPGACATRCGPALP